MSQARLRRVPRSWQVPAALLLGGALVGACASMGILQYVDGSPTGTNWANAQSTVLNAAQDPSVQARMNTSPQPGRDDPASAAMAIKPIEDLQANDRVVYQNRLCQWRSWGRSKDTSMINCSGRRSFQTQTFRLTPVEMKAAG